MSPGADPGGRSGAAAWLHSIGRLLLRVPRGLAWLIVLAWAGLIWFASSQRSISFGVEDPLFGIASNLAHAPIYGLLAMWVALCAPRASGWVRLDARIVGGILVTVLGYAIADEVHQAFVPGRDPSVCDLLTDMVGAYFTLRVAEIVGRAAAHPAELARAVALGLFASLGAAAFATWVPPMVPEAAWL